MLSSFSASVKGGGGMNVGNRQFAALSAYLSAVSWSLGPL